MRKTYIIHMLLLIAEGIGYFLHDCTDRKCSKTSGESIKYPDNRHNFTGSSVMTNSTINRGAFIN
jgi:hypothetical protein